jgi:hypothetical protein
MSVYNALMIRTEDKRVFFTSPRNLSSIKEFVKSGGIELSKVRLKEGDMTPLSQLAAAICDGRPSTPAHYEVVERIWPNRRRKKSNAQDIKGYVRQTLLERHPLSLKDLKLTFGNLRLTDSCLCMYFSAVRKALAHEGLQIQKTGAGKYRVGE